MWLITKFGFFSIVEKKDDRGAGTLTIRSRTKQDLERLQNDYLPSLGPIEENTGTDYRFRAKADRETLSVALQRVIRDLDYDNFKSAVASSLGWQRADLYHRVWDVLYSLQTDKQEDGATFGISGRNPKDGNGIRQRLSYGGVLLNTKGQVLLRKPRGEYDDYVWTFAKGCLEMGATPEETALGEVREETGYDARIIMKIPGSYEGGTGVTEYFLMSPREDPVDFDKSETEALAWVDPEKARSLINETRNPIGRERDLAVLEAALKLYGETL